MNESKVDLYCDSDFCLKAAGRSPGGAGKVLKITVFETAYRPGRHTCPDCRCMMVPKKHKKPAEANRLGQSVSANRMQGKRINERHF